MSCDAHRDALNLTLSAPCFFSSGSKTGPITQRLHGVDGLAQTHRGDAGRGERAAAGHVSVRRPTSFVVPETMRSMNSGTPNGRRSLCATGSSSPRGGCSRRPTVSELTGYRRRSSTHPGELWNTSASARGFLRVPGPAVRVPRR